MEELFSNTSLIMALGPATGVFFLSIYFMRLFVGFERDIILQLIDEMKEDRKLQEKELESFKDAVVKIDSRLHYIEKVLDNK